MSVVRTGTRSSLKVVYKVSYDTTGDYPMLQDLTKTFNQIKETATLDQMRAGIVALMNLTVYNGAPYQIKIVDESSLVIA